MSMRNYNIDKLVSELDFNSNKFNDFGNGILITNYEVSVLDKYKIDYKSCLSLKELIYRIEDYLDDYDIEDLNQVSLSISERDYYCNTNK